MKPTRRGPIVGKIFINYRTADEPYGAALLDRALSEHFGTDAVFRAPKSIPLGDDFEDTILRAVRSAAVLLVVIGPNWLTVEGKDGRRRLDDPADLVRREIAEAFRHGVRVIPILMNATRITGAALPPDIADLATRQDVRVHFRNSHFDLPALVQRLQKLMPSSRPTEPPRPRPGQATGISAENVGAIFNGETTVNGDFRIEQSSGR